MIKTWMKGLYETWSTFAQSMIYILFFAYNEFKLDDWTKPVKKKWYEFQFDGNWHSLFNDWKEIINSCVKVRNIFSFFLLVLSEDQVSLDINYIILENTC